MIISITVQCDWRGCNATLEVPCGITAPNFRGWKQEDASMFSLHLCPEHRGHNWFAVKQQASRTEAPSTSNYMTRRDDGQ